MKIPVTIRLEPDTVKKIEALAKKKGVTLNKVLAGLVEQSLKLGEENERDNELSA